MPQIHPWLALGVVASTAATDAVYVMFSSAVAARRRVPAATWSGIWYLLSAFAVISYTRTWVYVVFAALGSWIGAFLAVSHPFGGKNRCPRFVRNAGFDPSIRDLAIHAKL